MCMLTSCLSPFQDTILKMNNRAALFKMRLSVNKSEQHLLLALKLFIYLIYNFLMNEDRLGYKRVHRTN